MTGHFKEERHRLILDAVQDNGMVTVAVLCRTLDVSPVTIRRDLHQLALQGLVHRAHGGALLASAPSLPSSESPVLNRMAQTRACKACIGRAAAALVLDGSSVFIGSGSTTAFVARHLVARRNLTVVTNALNISLELASAEGVTVVVTGGVMRASELSLIGHIAEQSLQEVRVDRAIIGIPALSVEHGLTNDYLAEVMTDRHVISMSPELVVVADHTKFGRVESAFIAPASRISTLVTDAQADPATLAQFRAIGIRVIVANGQDGHNDPNEAYS